EWKLIVHYEPELRVIREVFPEPRWPHPRPIKTIMERVKIEENVGYELYNIRDDPMEVINLADERRDVLEELKSLLDEWVRERTEEDPMLHLERYTQPQPVKWTRI
ncbi:MAG: hypothetical protein DRJ56_08195, partial [Thermoprotei archaeon]